MTIYIRRPEPEPDYQPAPREKTGNWSLLDRWLKAERAVLKAAGDIGLDGMDDPIMATRMRAASAKIRNAANVVDESMVQ